jgi:hypothetical protein
MEEITISKNPPREKGTFERIRVSKGIEKNYIIAAGLMFLGVIVIVAMFLPPCELGLTIFQGMMTGVLIAVGAIIVGITNMKVKSRKKALCNGEIVEGTVVEHGRKLNPTSSKRYFTITIQYPTPDGNGDALAIIKSSKKDIFELLPLNSKTNGIATNQVKYKVFFPVEIGVNLIIQE